MDQLSRRGLPRGSVARVNGSTPKLELLGIPKPTRMGREMRGLRRRRRQGAGATCPVASSMASGGMSALGSRGRARTRRVAKPTSAQARVCFELNAAVVVVAVLVLLHTSSVFMPWAKGPPRAPVAARGTDSSTASISLHCCDNCQKARVRPNSVGAQSAAIEQARVGIERCNQRIAEALGNPG